MRPGGYVMTKQTIHIGFVTPPPSTRRKMQVVVSPTGNKGELDVLVAEADSLLGKPKFQAPPREPRPLRPAKEAKPLGKIGL